MFIYKYKSKLHLLYYVFYIPLSSSVLPWREYKAVFAHKATDGRERYIRHIFLKRKKKTADIHYLLKIDAYFPNYLYNLHLLVQSKEEGS
jgi:hypothetical protein